MLFNNKVVIITGGSKGVGAATARLFANSGANLILVARNKDNLDIMANKLSSKAKVVSIAMDVTDTNACRTLLKKAKSQFGRIDILVNNAGYHSRGFVENIDVDDLGKMIDINLKAPIILSRLAIPYLKEAGGGSIVNIASLAGRVPIPGNAGYSASKAGLRSFTYALGDELRKSNIKLAVISPGPIDTDFIMKNIDTNSDLTFSQPISSATEVAQQILHICNNQFREQTIPKFSGFLTNLIYLFPKVGRFLRPYLEYKGAKVKAKLKAERNLLNKN
ncbi:MAG: short-chain dehydrogenase [Gammaproteobacteria bacterium]|nr:short-chain dehydrogenase [Gammaproteobacteria bacterium]|tara:strand:+ start:2321 stop:3151 length:831 start_codon:yes stop_codon:yes gene_type:complete